MANQGKAEGKALVRVTALAMRAARKCMSAYSCPKSKQTFTQPQLMACLILRAYLRTTYRGVIERLEVMPEVREALGLAYLPHFSTLQVFANKKEIPGIVNAMLAAILAEVGVPDEADAAMDSTGLEATSASAHFVSRAGRKRTKFVKLSAIVVCGLLLPAALVVDWGPSHDMKQAYAVLDAAEKTITPSFLWMDSAYDCDALHRRCWTDWGGVGGVASYAPPVVKRADGTLGGFFRPFMAMKVKEYGRRWHQESFHSALKRTMGSTLLARSSPAMFNEASIKVLAYAVKR
jgi:hypothetical protein